MGYASILIYQQKNTKGEVDMLNTEQKERLLKIARQTLESFFLTGKSLDITMDDPDLIREQGAFVTLTKGGELRGCIGRVISDEPLFKVVRDMSIEAAIRDPRFPSVTKNELENIEIEISALSPFEKIDDVNKIEVGKHGIMMRRGFNSGFYDL